MRSGDLRSIVLGMSICFGASPSWSQEACPTLPRRDPMPKEALPAVVPIPSWREQAAVIAAKVATEDLRKVRLVFIGDSITQGWQPDMWRLFWNPYDPINLGLSGDLTQGVLWRLHHGQWPDTLKPAVAVILIGTNNASWRSPAEDTALGIAEIVRFIVNRSPATKVLVLGILPRGQNATTFERPVNAKVNALIKKCADNRTVFYAEPGDAMVDSQGHTSTDVFFDYLHPTMVGYAILGAGIYRQVRQLASEPSDR